MNYITGYCIYSTMKYILMRNLLLTKGDKVKRHFLYIYFITSHLS